MALTEFQRRLHQQYNPDAFKTRKDLFSSADDKNKRAKERQQETEATHLAVRALLLGHEQPAANQEPATQQKEKPRKKKSKSKAKSQGQGKPKSRKYR